MNRKKTYMGLFVILGVIALGIGYAAIQTIPLQISGITSATSYSENFKVSFTDTATEELSVAVKPEATQTEPGYQFVAEIDDSDPTKASLVVTGLTTKGDKVKATYTITNASKDIPADVAVTTTTYNTDYFLVTTELENDGKNLAPETSKTVSVTVELIKTPLDYVEPAEIKINLTADPVDGSASNVEGEEEPTA